MLSNNKKSQNTDENSNGMKYAVFLLSLKLRTAGEVLKKMQQRGYNQQIIEETVERLKSQKYLDDQRYAEVFLENLKTYRNFGFYGIKKKMMEKKVPQAIIEQLLQDSLPVSEEIKIAKRLLKKEGYKAKSENNVEEAGGLHYQSFGDNEQNKEKQKMASRLKARGFRGEVITKLLF